MAFDWLLTIQFQRYIWRFIPSETVELKSQLSEENRKRSVFSSDKSRDLNTGPEPPRGY